MAVTRKEKQMKTLQTALRIVKNLERRGLKEKARGLLRAVHVFLRPRPYRGSHTGYHEDYWKRADTCPACYHEVLREHFSEYNVEGRVPSHTLRKYKKILTQGEEESRQIPMHKMIRSESAWFRITKQSAIRPLIRAGIACGWTLAKIDTELQALHHDYLP
jgi:hypothetical protein